MFFTSIEQTIERLGLLRSRRRWWRRFARRSAVALILREGSAGVEVLMIQRAEREGDRWSGHMAFPGGVLDASDRHSLAAAARETVEEIGLDLALNGHLVARLSDIVTVPHRGQRRPMVISPYIFALTTTPTLAPNDEVAAVIWVPLRFFADRGNRGSIRWRSFTLGCYTFQGQRIWGLSLQMIDEMMRQLGVATVAPGALRENPERK